jgi:hypothetical protein
MQLTEQGVDPREAALAGRDITIDFARAGLHGRAINQFVPYFNVGLQAPAQIARALSGAAPGEVKPGQAEMLMRIGTMVVAPVAVLETYNRTHASYADVPDYDKDRALIIMDPRGPGPVNPDTGRPTPRYGMISLREWSPFAIATRNLMDKKFAPQDWAEMAWKSSNYISPISMEEGPTGVVPPWIMTTVELQANYDFFRQRQITPGSIQDRLPEEQYLQGTSETAKAIGRVIGKPPTAIEHAIRGFGTGVAGQALAVTDMAGAKLGVLPEKPGRGLVKETPVVGGLVGRFYREQGGQQNQDMLEKAQADFEGTVRRYGLRGDEIQKPTRVIGDVPLNAREYAEYYGLFNTYLREELLDARESADWDDDRQEAVKEAASRARRLARDDILERLGLDPDQVEQRQQRRAAR